MQRGFFSLQEKKNEEEEDRVERVAGGRGVEMAAKAPYWVGRH